MVALLAVVGLGALAVPLKDLHLAFPTDSTAAADTTQRKASDLVADAFGPGRDAPLLVVVDGRATRPSEPQAAYGAVTEWAAEPGRRHQRPGRRDERGRHRRPDPDHARQPAPRTPRPRTCSRTCATARPASRTRPAPQIGVTGLTAITTDVSERLSDALPIYLAVVVGLAFLLLMIVFRSILVPLTATFGFLLSVLATLGVTVAVFQEGAFGLMEGQPIVSFMPIFLIGLVFGLAMDYQVFLVTRMREAHVHGMSTREAVVDGFRNSARVVTAAAVIMISVFAAFILDRRADHQVDGLRARGRRALRRVRRADGADPGADVPARREGLVAAALAGPAAAERRRRGRAARAGPPAQRAGARRRARRAGPEDSRA